MLPVDGEIPVCRYISLEVYGKLRHGTAASIENLVILSNGAKDTI